MYEDHCYTCPLHQEQHSPTLNHTRRQELPGCRHALQDERVAVWISPPQYHYTDGVMATGHGGITVSCRAETATEDVAELTLCPGREQTTKAMM